jgi:hypothetical protein
VDQKAIPLAIGVRHHLQPLLAHKTEEPLTYEVQECYRKQPLHKRQ